MSNGGGVGDGLTRRTAAGLKWSYLAAASNALVTAAYVAGMSRMLSRAAFGLVAIATISVNFGLFFTRMGVIQSIIQRSDLRDEDVRVGATSSMLLGLVGTATAFLAAPSIARFFDAPDLVPLLRVLSLNFVLLGLGMTSLGLLRRQMRFREIAIIEMVTAATGAAVGLAAAALGAGVWSLVMATLTSSALAASLQYSRVRHSVRPLLAWTHARALYSSGSRFSLLRLSEFLGRNLDTIAVGRYLTTSATGVYSRTYTLVMMPMSNYLSLAFAKVLFPTFASIQADRDRLRRALTSVMIIGTVILFPVAAGMAVAAPDLVTVVLSDKFSSGTILVPIFAAAAALYILSHVVQLGCEAIGELNRTITVQMTSLAVLVVLLLVASNLDMAAFAGALAASEFVRHIAYLFLLRRLVALDLAAVSRAYMASLGVAVVVAVGVATARFGSALLGVPALGALVAEITAGALALALGIRVVPYSATRRELHIRIRAMGLVGDRRGVVERTSRLVLGPLDSAPPRVTPRPKESVLT